MISADLPIDESDVRLGETATTGRLCPRTGWWQCIDEGDIQGGRRQHFRAGHRMPHAVLVGQRTLWQRLTGASRPTHPTVTVWTLIEYDPPLPPAPSPEPQAAPASQADAEHSVSDDDDDESDLDAPATSPQTNT